MHKASISVAIAEAGRQAPEFRGEIPNEPQASDKRSQLHEACAQLTAWLEATPEARKARWSLDIDPQTLS
ncbi:hypothetical protein [Halomonas alkalisoli]|uniref:hypothetical protein n=1 Tax=Halomonas alkalisoli TaxID=2907158 RepID=UPI001F19B126|nr:hypothetical protein [Halomonas alkalisoli]MCE9681340.1 hypothetical protein [Halomonas alkalisoli]